MNYKGYEAVVEFDPEYRLFTVRVINTQDVAVSISLGTVDVKSSST